MNSARDNTNNGNNQSKIFVIEQSNSSADFFERNPIPNFSKPIQNLNDNFSGSETSKNKTLVRSKTDFSDDENLPPQPQIISVQ